MLTHIWSMSFTDATTPAQRAAFVTAMAELPTKIDGVESFRCDLTIKGITRPVTIPFDENGAAVDPFGTTRIGFEGSTTINRKDWDLTWNAALETGGVLVSEKIKLEFDISAIKHA